MKGMLGPTGHKCNSRATGGRELRPLFVTRGVPGTHDLGLLENVLDELRAGRGASLPRFDKTADDRVPAGGWESIDTGRLELIVIEGWCLGLPPQADTALAEPVNTLEALCAARVRVLGSTPPTKRGTSCSRHGPRVRTPCTIHVLRNTAVRSRRCGDDPRGMGREVCTLLHALRHSLRRARARDRFGRGLRSALAHLPR